MFGIACIQFLLNVTVHHHVEMYIDSIPAVAEKLLQSIYVDDVICGANEELGDCILIQEDAWSERVQPLQVSN